MLKNNEATDTLSNPPRSRPGFEKQAFTLLGRECTEGRTQALVDILACHHDLDWRKAPTVHISWRAPLKTLRADVEKSREERRARRSELNDRREAEQQEQVHRRDRLLLVGLQSLGFAAQAQARWGDVLTPDQKLLTRRLRSTRSIYAALLPSMLAGPPDLALEIASLLGHAESYPVDAEAAERESKIRSGEWVDITTAAAILRVGVKKARGILEPVSAIVWWNNGWREKHLYAKSAVVAAGNRRGFGVVTP